MALAPTADSSATLGGAPFSTPLTGGTVDGYTDTGQGSIGEPYGSRKKKGFPWSIDLTRRRGTKSVSVKHSRYRGLKAADIFRTSSGSYTWNPGVNWQYILHSWNADLCC